MLPAFSPGSTPLAKFRADLDASRHLLTAAGRSHQLATAGLALSATLDTQRHASIAKSEWAKGLARAKVDRAAFVKASGVRRLSQFDEYRKLTDAATAKGLVGQAATQYKAIEASNSMGLASQLAKIPKTFEAFPAADRIQKARMMGKISPGIAVQPVAGIGGHESSLAFGLATDRMSKDISQLMKPLIAPGIRSFVEMSERTRPMYDMTAYRSALDRAVGAPTARAIRDLAAWTEAHGLDVEPTAAAVVLPVEENGHALPVGLQYLWRYATTLNPNQCGSILQLFGYLLLLHNSGNVVGQVMTVSGLVLGMTPTNEQMQR